MPAHWGGEKVILEGQRTCGPRAEQKRVAGDDRERPRVETRRDRSEAHAALVHVVSGGVGGDGEDDGEREEGAGEPTEVGDVCEEQGKVGTSHGGGRLPALRGGVRLLCLCICKVAVADADEVVQKFTVAGGRGRFRLCSGCRHNVEESTVGVGGTAHNGRWH